MQPVFVNWLKADQSMTIVGVGVVCRALDPSFWWRHHEVCGCVGVSCVPLCTVQLWLWWCEL